MSNLITITDATFDQQVTETDGVVLVCFWAAWSAPSQQTVTLLEGVATDYVGKATIAKMNFDEAIETTTRLGIKGIPMLLFYKSGSEYERINGFTSKDNVKRELDRLLV